MIVKDITKNTYKADHTNFEGKIEYQQVFQV